MDEPWQILREFTQQLNELKIEYMIVGSTAMRAYVPGRSTFDTDVVVQMTAEQLEGLLDWLGKDWYVDTDTARRSLSSRRMFNAIHYATSWKLDLIPLKDEDYQREEFARRRKEMIANIACFVQAPEDLVLSKLLWAAKGGSGRQVEDVRTLLRSGLDLDQDYLRRWSTALRIDKLLQGARDA